MGGKTPQPPSCFSDTHGDDPYSKLQTRSFPLGRIVAATASPCVLAAK